tara:strand:- start:3575 stop:4303 length:729 start_codon:yes stop_codon:yes gene_type:complete
MPRWIDDGIVLGTRPFGENSVIMTCFTKDHGLSRGLVKSGRRKASYLQAGNQLSLTWSARLEEQLGLWAFEPQGSLGGILLGHPLALAGLIACLALTETVLPEREPQTNLYQALLDLFSGFEQDDWFALYVNYEICLLQAAGFRLALQKCVATGTTENLTYVSPKSGGAVCFEAGAPYKNKLLPLPECLAKGKIVDKNDLLASLNLTEYFFDRYILEHASMGLPAARHRFKDMLKKDIAKCA